MRADPQASSRGAHLAVFDAQTFVAKGVRDHLVGRSFPIASMRFFSSEPDPEVNLTEFAGEAMFVSSPDPESLGPLDIAFFCGSRPEGERYLAWPAERGFTAIDLSSAARPGGDAPPINVSVNGDRLGEGVRLVPTPHPIALMLSTVLAAAHRGCGLRDAAVTAMQPVSEMGEEGINELYRQTLGLLNFQEWPQEIFGRQLAFNLVPAFTYRAGSAPGRVDGREIEEEIRLITGPGFELAVGVLLAPVFHCHAALARLVLAPGKSPADLAAALEAAGEIKVDAAGSRATPVDRAGQAGILVAGPWPAGSPGACWIWIVSDNLQAGAALNAVRIAETLWRRPHAVKGNA
ncbi:MAG TPA: Asd/ArgC dimerization domain-containing protein [Candidatus Polarisedimenticolia bacterium]|nr:Asd/ArgC dimerization domain-containing protein [Candidatus Polarisedimenticolia bacterium]